MLREFVVNFYQLEILDSESEWLMIAYMYIYDYISNKAILTLAGCFRKQAQIIFWSFLIVDSFFAKPQKKIVSSNGEWITL